MAPIIHGQYRCKNVMCAGNLSLLIYAIYVLLVSLASAL